LKVFHKASKFFSGSRLLIPLSALARPYRRAYTKSRKA